jgi:hypothetical protein
MANTHYIKEPISCAVMKLIATDEVVIHALDRDAIHTDNVTEDEIMGYLFTVTGGTVLTMTLTFNYSNNNNADLRVRLYVDPALGPQGTPVVDSAALAAASGTFSDTQDTPVLAAGTYHIYATMIGGQPNPDEATASLVTVKQVGSA